MPAPTTFKPIDLEKPGLKKRPGKKLVEPQWSQEIIPVPERRKYSKDELLSNVKYLSQRLTTYLLDGDRLERLMAQTSLKDLGVLLGITTEKMLLLEGQPTQIIGQPQQAKLDQLGTALDTMLKQRGLAKSVTLTERTATIDLNASRTNEIAPGTTK